MPKRKAAPSLKKGSRAFFHEGRPFLLADELSGERFIWQSRRPTLEFNPHMQPARILSLKKSMRREQDPEQDFDYFF